MLQHRMAKLGIVGLLLACSLCSAETTNRISVASTGLTKQQIPAAVDNLLFSAHRLMHSPEAPARAARLLSIVEFLAACDSDNIEVQRLRSDIYQSMEKFEQAAQAARKVFDDKDNNYTAFLRWMRFKLNTMDRLNDRADFLNTLLDKGRYLHPAMKAEICVRLADMFHRRGAKADALAKLKQALQFDPYCSKALLSQLELSETVTPKLQMETIIALLQANPRSWWVMRQLAAEMNKAGLNEQSLPYYYYTWQIWQSGELALDRGPAEFLSEYLSAMLDAGQYFKATGLFGPAEQRLVGQPLFQSLLCEAYRASGQDDKASVVERRLTNWFNARLLRLDLEAKKNPTPRNKQNQVTMNINAAWLYLLTVNKPLEALKFARKAQRLDPKNEAVILVIGACELAGGNPVGLEKVKPLMDRYALGAVFVARYALEKKDMQLAKQAMAAGFELPRTGWAYRQLKMLAKKHKLPIPLAANVKAVQAAVDSLDPRVLQLALQPQKFVKVTVKPLNSLPVLGDPIELEVSLTNKAEIPISVGPGGMISHRMAFQVTLSGQANKVFPNVPVSVWPSPRYLQPGKTETVRLRIDAGSIHMYLVRNPLRTVQLVIQGVVSPQERGRRIVSGLAPVRPMARQVRRTALLAIVDTVDEILPRQYSSALRKVETDLGHAKLQTRLRATRRVGSLLCWYRRIERKKDTMPEGLARVVNKNVLLGLVQQALKAKDPLTRASMVTALQDVPMDGAILNTVGPVIEDPSPLVRMRVAELLGSSNMGGTASMLQMFAGDKNPLVRMMARNLQRQIKPAAKPKSKTAPAKSANP